MEKAYIKKLINSIDSAMSLLQEEKEHQQSILENKAEHNDFVDEREFDIQKQYIEYICETICDLDTIRQEYEGRLNK